VLERRKNAVPGRKLVTGAAKHNNEKNRKCILEVIGRVEMLVVIITPTK
jgi:hypothetical protein